MNRKIMAFTVVLILMNIPLLAAEPTVLIQTGQVTSQMVSETLTAYGEVQPDADHIQCLSLRHAGLVNRVWVQPGQRVKNGDRLVETATAPEVRMQYLQAQNAVNYAGDELARQQRLFKEQLATRSQVDAARKALQDAETSLKALQQQGQGKKSELLTAPMDGIVIQINVSRGQQVRADTTAVLIAAEHHLIVRFGVEPDDLPAIKMNAPVQLSSVFAPDRTRLTSRVRNVHAMINPATRLVNVTVPIPGGKEDHLVLGTLMVGRIQLAAHQALTVPRSAVREDSRGAYLFRLQDGRARRVAVTAGEEQDDWIEVKGDLQAGETIIISGNYELRDGMAVREEARQ